MICKKNIYEFFFEFFAAGIFQAFLFVRNIKKIALGKTYQNFKLKLLFCILLFLSIIMVLWLLKSTTTYYVPPKFVGFRSKHLRSKDKRGFIGRVTNCQKDKNHNSWNFYNRSKVIPVTWQSIVCSASKKFFHSRQMGQWELISNFPIFQHQYQTTGCMVIIIRKMEK